MISSVLVKKSVVCGSVNDRAHLILLPKTALTRRFLVSKATKARAFVYIHLGLRIGLEEIVIIYRMKVRARQLLQVLCLPYRARYTLENIKQTNQPAASYTNPKTLT